jgi:hypothetical protein
VRWFLAVFVAGCSAQPAPILGVLSPSLVCGSGVLPAALHGENFLARPIQTLDGAPSLEVPRVKLTRESGGSVYPDVVWISTQLLSLGLPLDELESDTYALELTAPDGQTARRENALERIEVAPVRIFDVRPEPLCLADGERMIEVVGAGIDPAAQVTLRDATGETVFAPAFVVERNRILVTLPRDAVPPADYTLVVENPEEAGCRATAAASLTVNPPPRVTVLVPANLCRDGARMTVTGLGLQADATAELREPASGDDITATRVELTSPTSAVVTFGTNSLPRNVQLDFLWHNPDGCSFTLEGAVRPKPGEGGCD